MPELTIFPFVSCLLTIALIYKFVTPRVTGGNVALKNGSSLRYAVFSLVFALVFTFLYYEAAVRLALALTPYVRDFVNSADAVTEALISCTFRGIILQMVLFALTLLAGKFCKNTITVNGWFNAWKAAWIPAVVIILLIMLMTSVMMRMLMSPS